METNEFLIALVLIIENEYFEQSLILYMQTW